MIDRDEQYRLMQMERPKKLCDMGCKRKGEHMHEIISRAMTQGNKKALNLSFNRFICAWLCPWCHEQAHNGKVARQLLIRNCRRYGYARVKEAFDAVEAEMGRPFLLTFPKEEEI